MTPDDNFKDLKALARAQAELLRNAPHAENPFTGCVVAAQARCESPIEEMLISSVICDPRINGGTLPKLISEKGKFEGHEPLLICPQRWIGGHRADFAIVHQKYWRRLVIECDGFEYHDRNVQLAQRDKQRDRAFLIKGWPVMRFNGTEINRKIAMCLDDIAGYLVGGDE